MLRVKRLIFSNEQHKFLRQDNRYVRTTVIRMNILNVLFIFIMMLFHTPQMFLGMHRKPNAVAPLNLPGVEIVEQNTATLKRVGNGSAIMT